MSYDVSLLNEVLTKTNALLDHYANKENIVTSNNIDSSHAFRWSPDQGAVAIEWRNKISTEQLLFVDRQRKILRDNTAQFTQGLPANNTLLWGARGTGKSSLLQSIMSEFFASGLKVIEINREHLHHWPEMAEWLYKQSSRFIIYCDDLSFDQNDSSYKSVKAALDGSLTSLPDNALMYSTSNRRHLLPEFMSDNHAARHIEAEIHHSEAVEEAISLSDRFGLWLSFHAMTQDQYLTLVKHWLAHFEINASAEAYQEEALRWALQRGSRSGRIANQFARYYAGKQLLNEKQN